MAEECHPGTWDQTDIIIQKICTFLCPTDLSCFRLVCKRWKDESSPFWEYCRMNHTLSRHTEFGLKSDRALNDAVYNSLKFKDLQLPELTVFKKYRPRFKDCDFDCVGAKDLRDFFSRAKKDDAQLKDTSFRVIKLRKWNRFGNFPSGEQEGAKWFITEVANKVMQLTLDICNLSMSQGDFFPTLCRMTQLKKLKIRGTYFQLRPSYPVEPTLAEISPLPNFKALEMNYANCTTKDMPNYYFPWNLILRAMPNMKILVLSYSTWNDLHFADDQFSKLITALNGIGTEEKITGLSAVIFKCLAKPDDPPIPKKDVVMMVFGTMIKLDIKVRTFSLDESGCFLPANGFLDYDVIDVLVGSLSIFIKFEDREGKNLKHTDAKENRQDKNTNRVESVTYDHDHDRTSKALFRATFMSSKFALDTAVGKSIFPNSKPHEFFTVFQDFGPTQDCDFNCVGAEELRNFFLGVKKNDNITNGLMHTTHLSFAFLNLRNWNYFGNFPSGHQGAKWFLNEISDQVVHLALDECNLSMSQGEFFPALCKLTHLEHLTIRGTYFQLPPSSPVEPTMDEISPLPYLLNVEMNYEMCTTNDMPNYYFPWNLLLGAHPKLFSLQFSYSNRTNLDFAIQQFFKMMDGVKKFKFKPGELKTNYYLISFNHLAGPHADPSILKKEVMKMVSGVMKKLCVPLKEIERHQFNRLYPEMKSIDMMAHVQNYPILLRFRKSES